MKIEFCTPAARNTAAGHREHYTHFYLHDAEVTGLRFIARVFPDGRVEYSTGGGFPLSRTRDAAVIERMRQTLAVSAPL